MDKLYELFAPLKQNETVVGWYNVNTEEIMICNSFNHNETILSRPEYLNLSVEVKNIQMQQDEDYNNFVSQFEPDEHIEWHIWEIQGEEIDKQIRSIVRNVLFDGWIRFGYYVRPSRRDLDIVILAIEFSKWQSKLNKLIQDLDCKIYFTMG